MLACGSLWVCFPAVGTLYWDGIIAECLHSEVPPRVSPRRIMKCDADVDMVDADPLSEQEACRRSASDGELVDSTGRS